MANLAKLIRYAQNLPAFRGLGRGLTSNDIRAFLMREKKHAREVFSDFYVEEEAMAVLTYEWTLELWDSSEYIEAFFHIILGTSSVGGRAWCLH